ncbi:MAG: DNA polymerase III subunit gamma/tau [Planctomycetales bacterium]|nr:DNA polymerase III subunit gamma/tau [Planctomycetales bacterium]
MTNPSTSAQYMVVARRYRPQTFEELIGQQQVSQALGNAITTGRVGHAYLFTGARGVGKTSAARILSKALNCQQGPTITPCNVCNICQSVAAGEDVDVLEIDGASNRGIDEIRQLRANVGVRPSRSRYKIYIIDEVHMLTKEAFNALLKTLEEPPEHVKFIFCTTDPEKIPITVLSRCQRFDFAPVETGNIVGRLSAIVAAEGATAEPEALEIIARRAAGSMRDSQSLLEQLLSFQGTDITVAGVHQLLGTAHSGRLHELSQRLMQRDAAGVLTVLDQAVQEGVDVGQLAEQLLTYLRDVMVAGVGGDAGLLQVSAASQYGALRETADTWGLQTVLAALQILDQTVNRMRTSMHGRTLLEMALIRIANLENLQALADALSQSSATNSPKTARTAPKPDAKKKLNESSTTARTEPAADGGTDSQADGRRTTQHKGPKESVGATPDEQPRALAGGMPEAPEVALSEANALEVWQQALEGLEGLAADFAGKFAAVAAPAHDRLVVTFPTTYNSSKAFCERPERRSELERAVAAIVRGVVKIDFQLSATTGTVRAASAPRQVSKQDELRRIQTHGFVVKAQDLFDGSIRRVDPAQP